MTSKHFTSTNNNMCVNGQYTVM